MSASIATPRSASTPTNLAVTLAIGIPIAWYLSLKRPGRLRVLALRLFVFAALVIVLLDRLARRDAGLGGLP
jgi:ABC-type spermidine/putrescine transport system permease subunit I